MAPRGIPSNWLLEGRRKWSSALKGIDLSCSEEVAVLEPLKSRTPWELANHPGNTLWMLT
jgi:hypothetical protein